MIREGVGAKGDCIGGIVADLLPEGVEGEMLALRADMDALPIKAAVPHSPQSHLLYDTVLIYSSSPSDYLTAGNDRCRIRPWG